MWLYFWYAADPVIFLPCQSPPFTICPPRPPSPTRLPDGSQQTRCYVNPCSQVAAGSSLKELTMPQVFIGGALIGGYDTIAAAQLSGELYVKVRRRNNIYLTSTPFHSNPPRMLEHLPLSSLCLNLNLPIPLLHHTHAHTHTRTRAHTHTHTLLRL